MLHGHLSHEHFFLFEKVRWRKKMLCRQNIDALQMREKDGEKVKYEKDILSTSNFFVNVYNIVIELHMLAILCTI